MKKLYALVMAMAMPGIAIAQQVPTQLVINWRADQQNVPLGPESTFLIALGIAIVAYMFFRKRRGILPGLVLLAIGTAGYVYHANSVYAGAYSFDSNPKVINTCNYDAPLPYSMSYIINNTNLNPIWVINTLLQYDASVLFVTIASNTCVGTINSGSGCEIQVQCASANQND